MRNTGGLILKKLIFILVILSFTLSGCWDSIETENLGLVRVIGIGLDKTNNLRVLIQEVPHEKQSSSAETSGGGGKAPFHIFAESGTTISQAIQKMSANEHHKLYFAHAKIIILDEELVRLKGINPIIDFFQRNEEIRPNSWLLIAPRGQLDKILSTDVGIGVDAGRILEETINNNKVNPYRTVNNLSEVIDMLYTPGSETYTAGVILDPRSSEVESNAGSKPSDRRFIIQDTAVFKDEKMVGWLKDEEHKGVSWAKEHVKGGVVTIPFEEGVLSLRVDKVRSKLSPKISAGKMQIDINTEIAIDIEESQVNYNFTSEEIIEKVEQFNSEKVKREIGRAVEKSRNLNTDFLGIGNCFNIKYPKYWKSVQSNWYSYFPNVEVNINVSTKVRNIGNNYKRTRG